MQSSATFFGGAVLGGILAAACGFDLFPGEGTDPASRTDRELESDLRRQNKSLEEVRLALSRSQEHADELQSRLETEQRARKSSRISAASREARRVARAKAHTAELARLREKVAGAEETLAVATAEVRKTKGQLHRQLLRFFARGRDPRDAVLVSEYLASGPSKEEQQDLFLQLIKWNKEVLQALPRDPSRVAWPPRTEVLAVGAPARGGILQEGNEASIRAAASGTQAASGDAERGP